MISQYEAVKLQRDMRHELDGPNGAVGKCAAGLAVLALIAAVGTYTHPTRSTVDVAEAPAATAGYVLTPLPERD